MSRKFRFTVPYSVPVEELHRAIINDEMWTDRFAEAPTATLDLSHPAGPGTIRVRMTETAPRDKVPALVRKVLDSDLSLDRTDDWGPLTGGTATGTFVASTTAITAEMTGTSTLRPTAQGSEIEYVGFVVVKVMLIGAAIEPLAEQLQQRVVISEKKFIEEWVAKATT